MTVKRRATTRRPAFDSRSTEPIPRRALGTTGEYVSALGLGGYHLGDVSTEREATRIVLAAIDAGVTFMDNAWDYHDGKSEIRLGKALAGRRGDVFLMTKVCTHGRDARVGMRMLEESLRRLKTDYLDLWQVHEVAYYNDPERHFMKGGVIEALDKAKQQGKSASSASRAIRIPSSICGCCRTAIPSTPCRCRSTSSTRSSGALNTACSPSSGAGASPRSG